jgi:DNA modification methylase
MKLMWHNEKRKISDLIPYDQNPRRLTDKQAKDLTKSLSKFDLVEVPAIDIDNKIIAGHQRCAILKTLGRGEEEIDVRVPNRKLTEKEFQEYNLRSNKNTGEWDCNLLANFDTDLLIDVGFDDLSFLNVDLEPDEKDDTVPDINDVESIAKLSDVWQLGRHKIICGDCINPNVLSALLGENKIDMLLTDPPYGVDYSNKNEFLNSIDKGNRNQTAIENDAIENYRQFFTDFLSIIPFADYNTIYCFMSGLELHNLRLALDDCDIKWGDYLVWVKNNHVLGRKDYNAKHEFIVYGWKGRHKFYGGFSTTVLEFPKPLKNDLHPTMKPIELLCRLLLDGSLPEMNIYDPFLGSGSTLIACEKSNRICYGCEIEPRYIDVIIKRWEDFTGEKVVKLDI